MNAILSTHFAVIVPVLEPAVKLLVVEQVGVPSEDV
jgi:hypothetical protein